jgi:N4-(beta-N-acetylglucosaminyl)-L-asparaginase
MHRDEPPLILSTWSFGMRANAAAWPVLDGGGDVLDAVEAACTAVECDPEVDSVGYGGLPNARGVMQLDGAIMSSPAQCGAVAAVESHLHPVTLARRVMDDSPHVMVVGDGADVFADRVGQPRAELLSPQAKQAWDAWTQRPAIVDQSKDKGYAPPGNLRSDAPREGGHLHGQDSSTPDDEARWTHHDTISVLALDRHGRIGGASSTSGYAYKLPGRVGDSPIIGHGLYVEPAVGGAVATGMGELIMGVCASFLVVEVMRSGATPLDAIRHTLARIISAYELQAEHQVALIALTPDGRWASGALREGYRTSVRSPQRGEVVPPNYVALASE